jgi:sensor histidine kinase YesM
MGDSITEKIQDAVIKKVFDEKQINLIKQQIDDMKTFQTMLETLESKGIDLAGLGNDVKEVVEATSKMIEKIETLYNSKQEQEEKQTPSPV